MFPLCSIFLLFSVSCDKADSVAEKSNFVEQNSKSSATFPFVLSFYDAGIEFIYEVNSSGLVINATLAVNPDGGEEFILTQNIDRSMPGYRLIVHKSVISEAQRFIANSSLSMRNVLQAFTTNARSLLENQNYPQEVTQYILHFNAILSTAARSEVLGSTCECLPLPTYFDERSPFWCQEDFYVNPASFLDAIDSLNVQPSHPLELELITFLNDNRNETEFNSKRVFAIFESEQDYLERLQNVYDHENGLNPDGLIGCSLQGSDLGCCGNYSGCCWYSSNFCLWHDVKCYECSHWWCLSGCVPG